MKRASYREAVAWIALNDDTEWLEDEKPMISVTVALVMDIFDVSEDKIVSDLRRKITGAKKKGLR